MSKDIFISKDNVQVTRFHGGITRGICYQINAPNGDYIQLTAEQCAELTAALHSYWKQVGEGVEYQ